MKYWPDVRLDQRHLGQIKLDSKKSIGTTHAVRVDELNPDGAFLRYQQGKNEAHGRAPRC